MKLSAAINEYWLDKRLEFSPNTIQNYTYVFGYLLEYLGDVDFTKITSNDIRRFLEHLRTKRKMGKRSVHDALIPLSSLWTWAGKEHSLPHIIRGKVTEPEYTKKKISPFSQAEVSRIVEATEYTEEWIAKDGKTMQNKRPTAARDKAIILTLVDCGLRASELCALTLADYDQKRGRLHIKHGKGDKERFVVIGNRTQKAILRYLANRADTKPGAPLFATQGDDHIKRENLYHLMVRIGERAEVDNVHPHRFRHTFAINFLRNGGNVALLQELLGHESLEMVLVYVELAEQDIEAARKHSPVDNWRI